MANITFLEAGGASTGGTELWNTKNGTWTVDTAVKPSGAYSSLARDLSAGGGIGSGFLRAANVLNGANRGSFYYLFTQTPANRRFVAVFDEDTLANQSGAITINTSGQLEWMNGNQSVFTAGSTVLQPNTWYRISYAFNNNGTSNNLDAKVYLNGVQEISVTGQNTLNTSTINRLGFEVGVVGGSATQSGLVVHYAHVYVDDGSDLSDPSNYQCTAKFPTTVNTNNFDTTGGTGAVNERPLNEANYKEQAGASQVSQDYNLQAINEGDVNLTGLTQVGYMGWIWAKESAVSGTPQITLNGTSYAITLTTSPAIYRKPITSAAYPSNAAAIGMVSSGTADDTFLYECGVVVAFLAPEQVKLATLAFAGR